MALTKRVLQSGAVSGGGADAWGGLFTTWSTWTYALVATAASPAIATTSRVTGLLSATTTRRVTISSALALESGGILLLEAVGELLLEGTLPYSSSITKRVVQ